MNREEKKHFFSNSILFWASSNNRNLPWKTSDPYKIWVSEIILQQTQVKQGLPYYQKFIERFPSVISLAEANLDEVYNYWKGLGYYSRARYLHETAEIIVEQHQGIFPRTSAQLKKLKGIGDYTARAIASFAFNEAIGVLDGNVHRVLSRYFGIHKTMEKSADKHYYQMLANALVPSQSSSGIYNQAIMDFGALLCTPRLPDCDQCPLQSQCAAFKKNKVEILPPVKKKIPVKQRFFIYFLVQNKHGDILIAQRDLKDIWAKLYELPGIEIFKESQLLEETDHNPTQLGIETHNISERLSFSPIKHQLSHQTLYIRFERINCQEFVFGSRFRKINRKNLSNFAFPKPIQSFLSIQKF